MSGGSPAPLYCPIRRLASCAKGALVCEAVFLRRLDFFNDVWLRFLPFFATQTSFLRNNSAIGQRAPGPAVQLMLSLLPGGWMFRTLMAKFKVFPARG
jgi:hypothetical protein